MRDLREPEEAAFENTSSTRGNVAAKLEKSVSSKPRLLIAADPAKRAALKKALESHFSIQTASSAREAIGQVLEGMETSTKYSQEIALATDEQAKVSNQVYKASAEVDERTQLIKTAGKLQLAQAIENVDLMNTQLALRQARIDLLAAVRRNYFALLIAREAVKINEAVEKLASEMLEELHASHADASFKRALRRYVKPQVLLIDEFGYEPFDSAATGYLFRLVSARHGVPVHVAGPVIVLEFLDEFAELRVDPDPAIPWRVQESDPVGDVPPERLGGVDRKRVWHDAESQRD